MKHNFFRALGRFYFNEPLKYKIAAYCGILCLIGLLAATWVDREMWRESSWKHYREACDAQAELTRYKEYDQRWAAAYACLQNAVTQGDKYNGPYPYPPHSPARFEQVARAKP